MANKTYASSKKKGKCATIGIIFMLGYISAVIELWRKNGIGHFLWVLIKRPIDLIDVEGFFLFTIGLFSYVYYILVNEWTKRRINRIGLFLCLFIIVGSINCLYKASYFDLLSHRIIVGIIFIQSFIVSILLYKDILRNNLVYRSKGIVTYLIEKTSVQNVLFLSSLVLCSIWSLSFFISSYIEIVEVSLRHTIDMISVYLLLSLSYYTYIYNLNHFMSNITVLSGMNKAYSLHNYIVLSNYNDSSITDKAIKHKNNQILYEYVHNLLIEIEETVSKIASQQEVKKVIDTPPVIRSLPKILLSDESGTISIFTDDITSSIPYRIYFYIFSHTLYERILSEAKDSQDIVKKFFKVILQIDPVYRKNILNRIESIRKVLKEIVSLNTEDLFSTLGIWSFQLTS